MDAIEHLEMQAWSRPAYYGGFSPDGDYHVLSRSRDSRLIERVNWEVACEDLDAEPFDEGSKGFHARPIVYHWRAGHWACGWVEYLCVRADAPDDIKKRAGEIVCTLADYPILDDDRYSEAEHSAVCEYWERISVSERVSWLQDAGLCVFAARRDELPEDPDGALFELLREGL